MTYDLTIGKRFSEPDVNEAGEPITHHGVAMLELPAAPAYRGSLVSRHANRVAIPYSATGDVERAIRVVSETLADALFGLTDIPALVPVTAEMVADMREVVAQYRTRHPIAMPRFEGVGNTNATLARLMILRWWMAYSLKHYGTEAAIFIH